MAETTFLTICQGLGIGEYSKEVSNDRITGTIKNLLQIISDRDSVYETLSIEEKQICTSLRNSLNDSGGILGTFYLSNKTDSFVQVDLNEKVLGLDDLILEKEDLSSPINSTYKEIKLKYSFDGVGGYKNDRRDYQKV